MSGYVVVGYLLNNFQNRRAIRIHPETQTLRTVFYQNTPPGGDISTATRIATRGSRKSDRGIARRVRFIFFPIVPDGYKPSSAIELPVLTPQLYEDIQINGAGKYKGFDVKFLIKIPESDPRG